jgi:hypothetical protein
MAEEACANGLVDARPTRLSRMKVERVFLEETF